MFYNECMRALLELSNDDFLAWLQAHGQPRMRARQIRRWIIAGRAESFEQMTDLPRDLRTALAAEFTPLGTHIARHLQASDGTHKLLLRLHDGQLIECVLIQEAERHTACVSTQVGCGMGCVFCASGLNGVERNLTAGEILEQLVRLRNLLPEGGRLTHVNLIPFNDVPGLPYRRPAEAALTTFVDTLRHLGISVKVRKRKGSEIDAACGQLRRATEDQGPQTAGLQSLDLVT